MWFSGSRPKVDVRSSGFTSAGGQRAMRLIRLCGSPTAIIGSK